MYTGVKRPVSGGLIVHEWYESTGGSEAVVDAMRDAYPDAELLTLWNNALERQPSRQTWLSRPPFRGHKATTLPLAPLVWRATGRRDRRPYDWVLVSSHSFAHHFSTPQIRAGATEKFVYAHTPARYLWAADLDPRASRWWASPAAGVLRGIDRRTGAKHRHVAANSEFTRNRIAASWGVDASVLYPPVDVNRIAGAELYGDLTEDEHTLLASLPDEFLFSISRLVAYKRVDRSIRFAQAVRLPLVVAGAGPLRGALEDFARASGSPVRFVGRVSDALLHELYRRARAVVFLAVEDFGIVPVEAMAAGTPCIVESTGGAAESVIDGVTGVHIREHSGDAYRNAMAACDAIAADACVHQALRFDRSVFTTNLTSWLGERA